MKKLYYILIITVVLLSCEKPISNFQSENFIKMYGSGYKSRGNDVIQLSEGGYLITGYDLVNNSDQMIYVAKVDENGNLIWEKTYGIIKNINEGKVIKEVSDGYIVAGTSTNSGITFPIILKLDFDGNEIYSEELDDNEYSITLNDIITTDKFIYIAGYSDATKTGYSHYYASQLNLNAELIYEKSFGVANNNSFVRVFSKNNGLLFLGSDGYLNNISIIPTPATLENGSSEDAINKGTNEKLVDAAESYLGLFTLSTSSSNTKLTLFNNSFNEVWSYVNNDVTAKTLTLKYDGTVMICAEKEEDNGITYIHFLKVSNGTLNNGDTFFKIFPGTVSRMKETKDKGFILIGTTNDTYGMNIQLIKTDKDYYMLKK